MDSINNRLCLDYTESADYTDSEKSTIKTLICDGIITTPLNIYNGKTSHMDEISDDTTDIITDKDKLLFELSLNIDQCKDCVYTIFDHVLDSKILVENNKSNIGSVCVRDILTNIIKYTHSVNAGLLHSWIYRKRQCYALFGWDGCWHLYALAPMIYVDDARPLTYDDLPVYFLAWDDDFFMYEIILDPDIDIVLPCMFTDEVKSGSTFKDISYCKAYVNDFVDNIRRDT